MVTWSPVHRPSNFALAFSLSSAPRSLCDWALRAGVIGGCSNCIITPVCHCLCLTGFWATRLSGCSAWLCGNLGLVSLNIQNCCFPGDSHSHLPGIPDCASLQFAAFVRTSSHGFTSVWTLNYVIHPSSFIVSREPETVLLSWLTETAGILTFLFKPEFVN